MSACGRGGEDGVTGDGRCWCDVGLLARTVMGSVVVWDCVWRAGWVMAGGVIKKNFEQHH